MLCPRIRPINGDTDMDKVTQGFARATTERLEPACLPPAEALEGRAATVRRNAVSPNGNFDDFASKAAETLGATAGYIQSHDVHEMIADAEALARRNPVPALVSAAALGLVLGAFLRRS